MKKTMAEIAKERIYGHSKQVQCTYADIAREVDKFLSERGEGYKQQLKEDLISLVCADLCVSNPRLLEDL